MMRETRKFKMRDDPRPRGARRAEIWRADEVSS